MSCVKAFKGPAAFIAASVFACGLWAQQPPAIPAAPPSKATAATSAPGVSAPVTADVSAAPAARAVSANATAPQGQTAVDPDSFEAITDRMLATGKAIKAAEKKIVDATRRIKDMLDNYSKAERNLTGFNGLGRVEQMELKAELYGGERLARKRLTEEFTALSGVVDEWNALKAKQREDQRLLALRRQIIEIQKGADAKSGVSKSAVSLADIEYYQVKKEADLRTISSYPEVYGTPEFWDYLYKANKDKLSDPDKPVPVGTTLVVPQDVKRLPDFNDL